MKLCHLPSPPVRLPNHKSHRYHQRRPAPILGLGLFKLHNPPPHRNRRHLCDPAAMGPLTSKPNRTTPSPSSKAICPLPPCLNDGKAVS